MGLTSASNDLHGAASGQSHWYAIHTKPKKEVLSVEYISRLGVEVFNPTIRIARSVFGVLKWTNGPFFPCYVFAKLSLSDIHSVNFARGVRGVVRSGDVPTPIDEPVIGFIRSQVSAAISRHSRQFQPGDRIIVNRGILSGVEGVLLGELSAKDRVRVLLQTIEGQAQLIVDKGLVERTQSL